MPRVIITVPEKNAQPYRFKLDRKVVSLGRGSDNDIVIDSDSVSGKHAEMHRVEGGYELADLGSTNGIKYDGTRQRVLSLRSGMSLRLGGVVFDFTLSEEELETLGREKPVKESPVTKEELASSPKSTDVPSAKRSAPRKQLVAPKPVSSGAIFGMILLFLVLAAGAFYAGLEIRHHKVTGEALFSSIMGNSDAENEIPEGNVPPLPDEAE
ncbi:MAG: FHA domain-containing protein [Akkermansiaceae bacterium]|nr:FHA domain-containing protein [Akkermansiaceae bacterium]